MVHLAIENLCAAQVEWIHINLWHLPEKLEELLGDDLQIPVPLTMHREQELLGTGGGLRNVFGNAPDRSVLVQNGDVLFLGDLTPLVEHHRATGALATLGLIRVDDASVPRSVILDDAGVIRGFDRAHEDEDALWTFSGIHIIEPELFADLPEKGCVVADGYRPRLAEGRIRGLPLEGLWEDIGTVERYVGLHQTLMDDPELFDRVRPDLAAYRGTSGNIIHPEASIEPGGLLEPNSILDRGARLAAGARVGPGVFISEGAQLHATCEVRYSVVMPFAEVLGDHHYDVVGGSDPVERADDEGPAGPFSA
jgi:NDP-sugar pyrophosphorylase family protein